MREVSFGQDGSVSAAGFEARYEGELANDWGNLASRSLAMIDRYRAGVIPDAQPDPALCEGDDALDGIDGVVRELLARTELTNALEAIWSRVRRLNRYVEENKPWELAKDEAHADRLDVVLYSLAEGIRVLALLLHAYMPETSGKVLEALAEGNRELDAFGARGGGARIDRISPLFPKLED
jgi:methionyl-tRNA synthetase